MKQIVIIIPMLSFMIFACEKETDNLTGQNGKNISNLIDTTIFSLDTLNYSFGYFGDEEGISIISQPKNSKSCELLNKLWEERILQYVPQDNFLGIDSISIVTMKGSDGASPSTDIDTFKIVVRVVKDQFHKKLIGKWEWIVSCGGVTGGCWYPAENYKSEIEFRHDMHYIQYKNDTIVNDIEYHLVDSFKNGETITYEIGFSNNYHTYFWFSGDRLSVQGGDFVEEYEKIELK